MVGCMAEAVQSLVGQESGVRKSQFLGPNMRVVIYLWVGTSGVLLDHMDRAIVAGIP